MKRPSLKAVRSAAFNLFAFAYVNPQPDKLSPYTEGHLRSIARYFGFDLVERAR